MKTVARNNLQWIVPALVLGLAGTAAAANRFIVEPKDLIIGQTGQTITIDCDNDFAVYGISMGIKFEQAKIKVNSMALAGAWATPAVDNDVWNDLKFNNTTGEILLGVVYDFSPKLDASDNVIPIGVNHQMITLNVDVLASASTTTLIDFRDGLGTRTLKNIMTNSSAASISPTLVDQTINIKSLVPAIQSVSQNSGKAGKEFFAVVTNLDLTGITIQVEVCGKALVRNAADGFKLLADKKTLDIFAPACGSVGFAPLKVTTENGSATEPNGFNYLPDLTPVITSIAGNSGDVGKVFQVVGQNLNRAGRAVKVCGKTATHTIRADGVTLDVTAPDCVPGWAILEVCTNDGCDSEANGFNYATIGVAFVRGDANGDLKLDIGDAVSNLNDQFLGQPARNPCRDAMDTDDSGEIDITDAIYILNYLFQAGPQPKPPFPNPGPDPTETAPDLIRC